MVYFKQNSALFLVSFLMTGCVNSGAGPVFSADLSDPPVQGENPAPVPTDSEPPSAPEPASPRTFQTDALLFKGKGTWADEVASLKSILLKQGATFREVTSDELNQMSLDEIAQYGMLIFPGGGGNTQAKSLSADTHARLRAAVQERGVSYIGFCAGAFIAVAPAPAPDQDVTYGLGIVDGPVLDYYYLENQGTSIAMTLESFADGTQRDLVWYGGPVTPNLPGSVVARYPNGDPAITQIWSGKGFVMLSAVHPAASQTIRSSMGLRDQDGLDYDLAWELMSAALYQRPLMTF